MVEGTPNSILTAEIINWTGKVIVAPRSQLPELAKREEAKRTGVYILAGEDPENALREKIYIGESDNVFKRLTEHNKDDNKDFWIRTALIISKDENLTKSHIRYLESKLIQLAQQARRGTINNSTAPETPPLPESDTADMDFFLSQVQMLLPVLGFSFTLPAPSPIPPSKSIDENNNKPNNISPTFFMKASGAEAKAQEINGEFLVLKDSTARKENTESLPQRYRDLREQLIEEGKLIVHQNGKYLVFQKDVSFNSASAAAATISGASCNGRITWKTINTDKTYKEWLETQIEEAEEHIMSISENQLRLFQEDNEEVSVSELK